MTRIANYLTALVAAAGLAATAAGQDCAWEHVFTPPPVDARATPFDIDGSGPDDVWIVGELVVGDFPHWRYHNYSAHFDGTEWTTIPVPSVDVEGYHNELAGVVAISPNEAYAAGDTKWFGAQQAQIFRWDGADWTLEALNVIDDVAIIGDMGRAGDQIWVVGERNNPEPPPAASAIALSLRRTDAGWVEEPVPALATLGRTSNLLNAVDGVSSDDAWAVGSATQTYTPGPSFGFSRYLVHWDGEQWTLDDTLPQLELSTLNDVVMIDHDDAWAVGYKALDGANQPMIVHYDGTGWTETELEPLANDGGLLRGVAARGRDDVYALGVYEDGNDDNQLLVYHYDGSSWQQVTAAASGGTSDQFMDATDLPDGTIWGVGLYVHPDSGPLTQRLVCGGSRPGDLDGDGDVDLTDLSILLGIYGTCEGDAGYDAVVDIDGSGCVDLADLSVLLANYGS